jgi:4-amino-4-deoxy-L-arabinose transferase-like glycosyltransferase
MDGKGRLNRRYLLLLVGFCLLQFFLLLGYYELWDIDEGMHAAIARNMILTGDWITPVFNGEPFFDKPALFNWMDAISFGLLGISEFSARLPTAIAGLGCVVLTYLIGRRAFGPLAGLLAGIVLASALEFAIVSRLVSYDVPFTFFTTLALFFFFRLVANRGAGGRQFLWFYVAVGLAVLVKGPLGLLLPAMVIGLYVVLRGRWSMLREMQVPLGILIVLVIAAPWYYLVNRANPGYLEYFFYNQNIANFFGSFSQYQPRHPLPWHYYAPVLLLGLFPWSLILVQSVRSARRESGSIEREYITLFLVWAVCIFVFFSLAKSKLPAYILPMFPAVALLVGRYCQQFLDEPVSSPRSGVMTGLVSGIVILAIFVLYAVASGLLGRVELEEHIAPGRLTALIAIVMLLLVAGLVGTWWMKKRLAVAALASVTPAVVFFLVLFAVPDVTPYRSSRDIGLAYADRLAPGEKMVFYGHMLDSALFYSEREAIMLRRPDELEQYLAGDKPVLVALRRRSMPNVHSEVDVIDSVGDRLLIRSRPHPAAGGTEISAE